MYFFLLVEHLLNLLLGRLLDDFHFFLFYHFFDMMMSILYYGHHFIYRDLNNLLFWSNHLFNYFNFLNLSNYLFRDNYWFVFFNRLFFFLFNYTRCPVDVFNALFKLFKYGMRLLIVICC